MPGWHLSPGEAHERYRHKVASLGNDRFMHYATPGVTSEDARGKGSVWWALRLNDMDTDAAMVVALLHHEMMAAYQDLGTQQYRLRELDEHWPSRQIVKNYRLDYEPWLPEEVEEARAEHEMRGTIALARYDYLRELLEAAYVG